MIGTSQLINTFSRPCFTDTTDIFKDGSGVALYGLDYDASDAGGTSGKFGEAAIFNGSSSKIELPSALSDGSTTATGCISFWFNVGAEVTSSTQSNEIMQFAGTSSLTGKIALGSTSGHMSGETFSVTHNVSGVYTYSTTNIPAGWNHAVVQWNSSDGKWDIYINSVKHTTYTVGTNAQGYFKLKFGNRSSAYYTGSLDQIRIYTSALTQSQITQLYQENNSTVGTHLFGCIANYNLDGSAKESMGTTAYDGTETDIIYRYDGIPTAVDFGVGGKSNYGARFNGSSSKVTTSLDFDTLTDYTISMWIKIDASPSARDFFAGTLDSSAKNGIYLANNTDETIRFYERNASGDTMTITSTDTINIGSWNHIVAVRDGNTDYLYINNGTPVSASNSTITHATGFTFGIAGAYATYFDGDIDQVRIFSKALNSTEVSTLYAETACVYTSTTDIVNYPTGTTPVAYYKLDNSSEDFSTGGNDGTDTNIEYRFGRFGQAAKFPALASSYINTGITSLGSDFSLSFWFNPDYIDGSAGYRAPLGKYYSGSGDAELLLTFYDNGNVTTYIYYGGGTSNSVSHTHTTTVSNGNWYHYCLTWEDGVALKTYIDTVATTTTTSQTKNTNTVPLYIGALDSRAAGDSSYNAYAWSGFIDQVRIYSTALDSDQVTELYNEKPETDTSNFKTVLYKGTSATQYISNVGMDLETDGGLVWIKSRDTGYHHRLFDSVRGLSTDGILYSNLTDEADNLPTAYDNFVSFDANGFTLGATSSTDNGSNKSGDNFVAWCWKAGGDAVTGTGTGVTNVSISANTDAGFSIVKYTGSGAAGMNFGHGLTEAIPELVIIKNLDNSTNWQVFGGSLFTRMQLDQTGGDDGNFGLTITSTTIQTTQVSGQEGNSAWNATDDYIAYIWHSVSGYSKIGSYTGNGTTSKVVSDPSFEPSFVMIKRTDSTSNWRLFDNRRGTDLELYANSNSQDVSATGYINFNSNGFEITTSGGWLNELNGSYLYMAFK